MAYFSEKQTMDVAHSVNPAAQTGATVTGSAVDLQNYGTATVAIIVGARTGGTYEFAVEESDSSGSGYTAVPASRLDGTLPSIAGTGDQNKTTLVGVRTARRYLRVVGTGTSTPNAVWGAAVIRGTPRKSPK